MREAVYGYLATKNTDRAYPTARLNRWLNDACNQLYADLPTGYLQTISTWAATSATAHTYTLWNQSTPVAALRKIVDLRLRDSEGACLREVPYDQLELAGESFYALSGADEQTTLTTNIYVDAGLALYAVYESWPDELSDDAHIPSRLPRRFHDLPCLMAAKVAFSSGAESKWPADLQDLLETREAQFNAHIGRRSANVMRQRTAA